MDPVICPDCGKEMITGARKCASCGHVIDGKKKKLIKILIGSIILAALITLITVLIINSGTPSAIAQARFYGEYPNTTITTITENKVDPKNCFINIIFKNEHEDVGSVAYGLALKDNKWVITIKVEP